MILEDFLLLRFRGTIRPVPPRLCDGVPGERQKRELEVIPQVEPPLVPADVQAGQGHRDVVVTSALLHRRLAQLITATREPFFKKANLKKYRKRC
jgi:hypothetical protein